MCFLQNYVKTIKAVFKLTKDAAILNTDILRHLLTSYLLICNILGKTYI